MNAQNYLNVHIGKLYRYDKKPKYFTAEMVEELMQGYAKHKTEHLEDCIDKERKNFIKVCFDCYDLVFDGIKYRNAIKELESDLQTKQLQIEKLNEEKESLLLNYTHMLIK